MDKVFNLNYLTEVDQITVDLKDDWAVFDFLYNLNFTRIKSIYKYTSEHQFQIEKNEHFLNWFDKRRCLRGSRPGYARASTVVRCTSPPIP